MLNFLAEGDIQGLVLVLDFETGVFFHRLIAFAFFLFSSFNLISLYCAYGSSLFPTQIDIRDVVAVIVESAESSAAHPITKRILVPDEEVRDGMLNDRNATTTTLIAAGTWLDEKLATSAAAAAAADGFGDAGASPTIADESLRPFMESLTLAAVLLLLILFCVIGNVFVIVAIACERDLRGRPQYYLIFSLAVADLVVGLIVTPLGAWSTVAGEWRFGITLCDIWISVDVIMCTASILHLVAIALDRYWSVTDISYVQNRTPKRIVIMLAVIWMTSLLISLAPFAGWKDEGFKDRVLRQHVCLMSQQISYQGTLDVP
ncbi:hypothetical protein Y032_0005g2744 [Ancylostoma ceylanicum]|nr:hypothetical protein Y032_0005g2744 [Ancylostoma ceylanicum]